MKVMAPPRQLAHTFCEAAPCGGPPYLSGETPYGTKAYTIAEARKMFSAFEHVKIRIVLTHGDLLESAAGQRHQGALLSAARRIWPRSLLRKWAAGHGLFMLIDAVR